MAEHSYTSRRELDQYVFHPAVTLLAPLVCLVLQVTLPKLWPYFSILDLPLLVTIFFAFARRSQIAGALTGTAIGLFQDGLTNDPFGVNGVAKAVIGYFAASIGFAVDMENFMNRGLMTFVFSVIESLLLYGIARWVLGDPTVRLMPLHELARAAANTVVGIPLYFLLDRFKSRE